MLKRYKIVVLIMLVPVWYGFLFANGADTLWTKTYGGAADDWGYSVQQTTDGGYIIAGTTSETALVSDSGDISLIKTDENGNVQWSRTYGDDGFDKGFAVKQTADGGYIICGGSRPEGMVTASFISLIKTDALGFAIWTKKYGGAGQDVGYSVLQTFDYGYAIAGTKGDHVFLLKTDTLGNQIWIKAYFVGESDVGYSLQQTTDSGFVITGYTASFEGPSTESDVYIIRTDLKGDSLWTKTYGGTDDDYGYSVDLTSDGGYIVAGYSNSFTGGMDNDVYLIKTDANGDTTWTSTFGGAENDWGQSVDHAVDGGYIIAGYSNSFNVSLDKDVYLVKTDDSGDALWASTYGGLADDWGRSVQQTSDGGYIIAGYTASFGGDDYDVYLIKTNPTKLISPDSGEQLTGGSKHEITWWCEHPEVNHYRILLSTDGGGTYSDTIADDISGDSTSWEWTVPDIDFNSCRIKIQVLDNTRGVISEDESNGDFTIGEPGVSEYGITDPGFMDVEVFPNPFREQTEIRCSIGHPDMIDNSSYGTGNADCIELEIYNVLGCLVKQISLPAAHSLVPTMVIWDGRDEFGKEVASGVYLMRFVVEDYITTKKLLLIR